MTCPHCAATLPPGSRFCPGCGQPLDTSDATILPAADVTHLAMPTRTPALTPSGSTSQTGWLTTSGSIDHGRFGPGTVLDNRYRVLGLLGRGGMGEVYRADDLRLGQQVALKFLPDLSRDPVRLAQFHNEVRTRAPGVAPERVPRVRHRRDRRPAVPHDGVRRRRGSLVVAAPHRPACRRTRRSRSRGRSAPASRRRTTAACCIAI